MENMTQKILRDTEMANKRLKRRMYKLMGKIAIFGGLNLNDGSITWLKIEELNDENGENSSSQLGIKYKDYSNNAYWPITFKNIEEIDIIADQHGYTLRVAVPREIREGYIVILMPR